jgi:hypothetical protein
MVTDRVHSRKSPYWTNVTDCQITILRRVSLNATPSIKPFTLRSMTKWQAPGWWTYGGKKLYLRDWYYLLPKWVSLYQTLMRKIKMILSISKWLLHPRYIHLRLYTMYGYRYITYILLHPLRFIKDLNNYINWCIMMDKYKWITI